jgi:DNA topoisomerase-2
MSATDDNNLYFDVQQKTDKQHILDNPDTYIGSVENVDANMWIMNDACDKIIEKNINYIPGLFKLFDEGIVNCRDHVVRMESKIKANVDNSLPVTYIDIGIQEDGSIIMVNDGNGIDVVQHPEYKTWVPELIFGHLRTSTNYNKEEKKIVGGKNGFGFKLVLIWSTYGQIETVDHIRGLKYTQEFSNNLDIIGEPRITKASKAKPYTKITFKPDYQRLGINGLNSDMISLLKKRVYDISAVTDKTIKVKYNSCIIPTKNFEQYINLYIGEKSEAPRVYEQPNARWEYAVALTPKREFVQVSFVNGIYTAKGGKHVEYILNQLTKKLCEFIEKKKKIKVNPSSIKEQLILFIRCDIENPAFDSQTKDYMNTPVSKFGSTCVVSDKFIEKVAKMGVMNMACAITEVKDTKAAKKTDGTKSRTIRGIPKLVDANFAGTDKARECILILCEGDSAKTGIISGLSAEDRNTIGVYPLKGKLMNVRGETVAKITANNEITEIKKILGLETGKVYNTIDDVCKQLRYGSITIMTDQDLDGSHIKGLGINMFQSEWPSLCKIPGFIRFMNTPILKAKKGEQSLMFYNDGEYEAWKNENNTKGWNIKYYKGLGTSTKTEFREYFQQKKFVGFQHTGIVSDDAIDMVFNRKRADDRKNWLETVYNRQSFADTSKNLIPYEDFINKELIHFSKYDCDRSIPNLMDGLKISLRKILFSAFKKRLTSEIKVAQFSGYVSEQSCYHHGEESLNKAIVGMAQNFVGSNNINLLFPSGQFGSRLQGGQDSASPRYIFTRLEKITRLIFPEQDDAILKYLNDDGTLVEPQFYVPIIPMILVNGSKGIGTGFSTDIMCYNPVTIIHYLKNKLQGCNTNSIEFIPYYEGFTGEISKISDEKFMFKGKYEILSEDKIRVTELPVGYWTEDFKELLDKLQNESENKKSKSKENVGETKKGKGKSKVPIDNVSDSDNDTDSNINDAVDEKDKKKKKVKKTPPVIKEVFENCTDSTIDFTITFSKGTLSKLLETKYDNGINGVEKLLKLSTTNSITNMNLFNADDKLFKYDSVEEIIDDYYDIRLEHYDDRKEFIIESLEHELLILSNKARYIQELLNDTIDLRKKKKQEIIDILNNKNYNIIDDDVDFKYLVKMPMDSVTEENVSKILNECDNKNNELQRVKSTTIQEMWLQELVALENEYIEYQQIRYQSQQTDLQLKKKVTKVSKKKLKSIQIE